MRWAKLILEGDEMLFCNKCQKLVKGSDSTGGVAVFLVMEKMTDDLDNVADVYCEECYGKENV